MWQAYYRHQFIKIFFLLLRLTHEFFGLRYWLAIKASYYVASAIADFRIHKGNENLHRVRGKLEKFFKTISQNSLEKFDYKKAAELELNWWMIDRYPKNYEVTREEALANAIAKVYKVTPARLREYADYRGEAMVVQDKAEQSKQETDWQKIEYLLRKSFNSLYENTR